MAGVNKAILLGRLGKDPEMRYTQAGVPICNFTLATSENRKDKDGNRSEITEWHRITAFNKQAELCGEHLKKGQQVYLEGKIQTREWEDRDGNKKYTTEILMNSFSFVGSKEDNAPRRQQQSHQSPQSLGYDEPGMDTGDVPF